MSFVLPVLFASIAVITFVVACAFFPIRITWFYETDRKPNRRPNSPKRKHPPPVHTNAALYPNMNSYRTVRDDDDYDDKEL